MIYFLLKVAVTRPKSLSEIKRTKLVVSECKKIEHDHGVGIFCKQVVRDLL